MTRDDDCIRALLLETEASDMPSIIASLPVAPKPEELKRYMHAQWLCDAGLFARVNKDMVRITNQGHDYLAAIRNDTVWTKTKDAASSLGGVTLEMMKDIAIGYFKQEASKLLGFQVP